MKKMAATANEASRMNQVTNQIWQHESYAMTNEGTNDSK